MRSIKLLILILALFLGWTTQVVLAKDVTVPTTKEVGNPVGKSQQIEPAKGQIEQAAQNQAQVDAEMIEGVNKVDGVAVDPKVFDEKKGFTLGDLNPIKWIFKPVLDMQKTVIHLEKQMMRLEAPIASLQTPMVGLRRDMVGVRDQMSVMHGDINNIHGGMQSVDKRLCHVEGQLDKIYGPVSELKDPVIALKTPVVGVASQLTTLKKDLKELKDVVSLTTTLILVAVVVIGLLIVVGTPIVALFAWKHRRKIMEKLGDDTSAQADPLDEPTADTSKVRPMKKVSGA